MIAPKDNHIIVLEIESQVWHSANECRRLEYNTRRLVTADGNSNKRSPWAAIRQVLGGTED